MKLNKQQKETLLAFAETGRRNAIKGYQNAQTPDEKQFYDSWIDRANNVLKVLESRQKIEIDDEEEAEDLDTEDEE